MTVAALPPWWGEVEAMADVLAFAQELTAAEPTIAMLTPVEWAERNRFIDGHAFSLARFTPLRELYEDDHPHIVVLKPAQRGVSEWAINRAMFALEHGAEAWGPRDPDGKPTKEGLNGAYLFPTQAALSDFSKERLGGLKEESAHLAGLFHDGYDDVTFKQVGRSYRYLRGAWSVSALLSFPADVLVLDEFDRMDPKAVALARRRLNASLIRREIDLSTPTVPGRGIDALYQQSDRRVYEQPCPRCAAWHVYEFKRDVRADGEPFGVWQYWGRERLANAAFAVGCPSCGHLYGWRSRRDTTTATAATPSSIRRPASSPRRWRGTARGWASTCG
ncbi:MAG TPA: phage terminase large subunit family protein [Thermomicrobiales bacterium]|jgi:phage terminase large subunit GpA-like protein